MTNSMKQFEVAAAEGDAGFDPTLTHTFTLGGVDYSARLPTKSEIEMWNIATAGEVRAAMNETVALVAALLHDPTWDDEDGNLRRDEDGELLEEMPDDWDPDAQMYAVERRWRDPRDPLTPSAWLPVIRWLIEEAAAFPTTSSSASGSGQPRTGSSSTGGTRPKASTRSSSRPAASRRSSSTRG